MPVYIRGKHTGQRLPLLLLVLVMLVISSCGINATGQSSQASSHNIATGLGGTPEPGNIRKPYIPTSGHYELLLEAQGITYFGSDNGNVYAMQAANGKMLWHYDSGYFVYAFAIMGGNLYAVGGSNQDMVYALNTQTGALQWKFQVDSPVFGNVASDGSIYINTNGQGGHGGSVYALDATSGSLRWHYTGAIDIPTSLIVADGVVYISPSNMHTGAPYLAALRTSDGSQLWRMNISQPAGTPVIQNGVFYINFSSGAIDAFQAKSGYLLWSYPGSANEAYQLTIAGNVLLANDSSGSMFALQLTNGKLVWQHTISIAFGDTLSNTPVINNGNISLYTHEGIFYSFRASDGALLWQHNSNHSTAGPVVATNGNLFVGTQDNVYYMLRGSDGSLLWQHAGTLNFYDGLSATQAFDSNTAYVGTDNGVVEALHESDGTPLWQYKISEKPILPDPVLSAAFEFKSSVSFASALKFVTDLGLQPAQSCAFQDSAWQPLMLKYGAVEAGDAFGMYVLATTASAPDWLDRLKANSAIQNLQANPLTSCPQIPAAPPKIPTYLPQNQAGTNVSVTFSDSTSYDTALASITRLGYRLANPCYEQARARGKQPSWISMGQEQMFANGHTLLLATTFLNATNWQEQTQNPIDHHKKCYCAWNGVLIAFIYFSGWRKSSGRPA